MKTFLFSTLITFSSILSLQGQSLEKSLLWKISGNGIEAPSYLFGTIHITCDATLSEKVKTALDKTTQVVLELDMDDPGLQAKMMGGMQMKDGKKISDLVSAEDFSLIDNLIMKEVGVSLNVLENMKPFMLLATLYPKMMDCPMQSYEQELLKVAKSQGEDILGLETVEEQLKVFDDIPYEDQVKDLLKSAKDGMAHDKENFRKMLAIYESEDINAMLETMNDESNFMLSKHQDKLLANRNKNWISKISEFAKDQPTFFGVGAGHLAGKHGVILLLRKAGYKVEPVK